MTFNTITTGPILLIGIEARTINREEINGTGKIPTLVQTFYSKMVSKISNRQGDHILSVYTDYESDENGYYTYFIGAKVKDLGCIPTGMIARKIPSARYAVIPSAVGKLPEIIVSQWQKIWLDEDLRENRAYSVDVELYDQRCLTLDQAQVDIYIAIKE